MRKIIVSLFTLLSIITLSAQNNTTGISDNSSLMGDVSVVIIPFEAKMYISDIDRDLAQNHQMNFQEIKAKFRANLDREIFLALKKYTQPFSFYSMPQRDANAELGYIYNSIGYKYEVVPELVVVKKENVGTKLLRKFKKKEKDSDYIDASIQGGELVSQVDNREKYMKTTVVNEKLLPNLNEKYGAQHYIFINQLDIKRGADMRYAASDEGYKREVKVHYTILDNLGEEVSSGAIKSRFSSNENDIDKIISVQFPLIAERIVKNLVGSDATEVE